MAACLGFVRSQLFTSAWTRCVRPKMRRGRLRQERRDALNGALMGMLKCEEILPLKLEEMARERKKKRRKNRKKASPMWDTRKVAADAARYGLISRYAARRSGLVRPPREQRRAERVTAMDPTIRAIQARKAQREVTQRVQPVSFLRRRRT
jgi:hypothetical protein